VVVVAVVLAGEMGDEGTGFGLANGETRLEGVRSDGVSDKLSKFTFIRGLVSPNTPFNKGGADGLSGDSPISKLSTCFMPRSSFGMSSFPMGVEMAAMIFSFTLSSVEGDSTSSARTPGMGLYWSSKLSLKGMGAYLRMSTFFVGILSS